jgi:hypothetical protein
METRYLLADMRGTILPKLCHSVGMEETGNVNKMFER